MKKKRIKGYKGFSSNLTCIEKKYEIGETYTEDEVVLCSTGMHFCENPKDVFRHYNPTESRFARVTATDVSKERDDDTKRVAGKLTIEEEITPFQMCEEAYPVFLKNLQYPVPDNYEKSQRLTSTKRRIKTIVRSSLR